MKRKSNLLWAGAIPRLSLRLPGSSRARNPTAETAETTAPPDTVPPLNKVSAREQQAGWESLFNGKDLDGWKRYGADTIGPALVCERQCYRC
ncbi:MAG: hypothetical protein WDO15_27475 [Bacteroidota bacterium]